MKKELRGHISVKFGYRKVILLSVIPLCILILYILSSLHKMKNTEFVKLKTTVYPKIYNHHNYSYMILRTDLCDNVNHTEVYLMIVVCSAPGNYDRRKTIRETWGSIIHQNKEVRLLFMMGNSFNKTINGQIKIESDRHKDIIQEDFIDSYKNLSIKSVAMLKWTSTYCIKAKYLVKADDDMFINIPYLLTVLKSKNITNSVIGRKITGARPIQNKNNKWYTSKEMFDGDVYPPYCSGTTYVISGDIVASLFNTTLVTKQFWLEDIYITGICREKIKANVVMDWGFTYGKRKVSGCAYRNAITGHENNPTEIRKIWSDLKNKSLKC